MILAGYETTANALAFALYLIAVNKAAESRITAEIDAFGRNRTPTYEDIEGCVTRMYRKITVRAANVAHMHWHWPVGLNKIASS